MWVGEVQAVLRQRDSKLICGSVSASRQSAMETKWLNRCRIRLRLLDFFFVLFNPRTLEPHLRGSATLW
jgi:hypothetical protein